MDNISKKPNLYFQNFESVHRYKVLCMIFSALTFLVVHLFLIIEKYVGTIFINIFPLLSIYIYSTILQHNKLTCNILGVVYKICITFQQFIFRRQIGK